VLCWPIHNSEGGSTSLLGIIGITEPDASDDIIPFGITFQRIKWLLSGCSDFTRLLLVMKIRRQAITFRIPVLYVYKVNRYWECLVILYDSSAKLQKSEISF
jgi:hypothetical protein